MSPIPTNLLERQIQVPGSGKQENGIIFTDPLTLSRWLLGITSRLRPIDNIPGNKKDRVWTKVSPLGELILRTSADRDHVKFARLITPKFVPEIADDIKLHLPPSSAEGSYTTVEWLEDDYWSRQTFRERPASTAVHGFRAGVVLADFLTVVDVITA